MPPHFHHKLCPPYHTCWLQPPPHTAPGAPLLPYNRLEATGRWLARVLQPDRDDGYVACVQLAHYDDTGRRTQPPTDTPPPPDELYAVVTAQSLLVAEVRRAAGYRACLRCRMPLSEVEQTAVAAAQLSVVSLPRLPPLGWAGSLNPLQAARGARPPPLFVCSAVCMDAQAAAVLHAAVEVQRAAATPSVVLVRHVGMPVMAGVGPGLASLMEERLLQGQPSNEAFDL